MNHDARSHSRWAFFWAIGQFGAQAIAGLFAFFYIARAVGPSAYADYVIGLVVIGVAQCFGLAIFREPVVQVATVTDAQLASVAKVSVIWSFIVGAAATLGALVWFYADPHRSTIVTIVGLLSARLFLDGVAAVPLASKARTLNLRLQASASITGSVILALVVLWSVDAKIGVIGLALGQLAAQVTQTIISLYFAKFDWCWRQGIDSSFVRDLMPKSASVVSWQMVDFVNGSLDRLFVSARMSSLQTGVYGFGKRLNDIIFETVGGGLGMVCLPLFSRANGDLQLLRQRFLGWVACSAFFVIPLLAYLFASADVLVVVLFGDKWGEAVPIYRTFLVLGVIQALGVVQAALIRGMGRASLWTRYLALQAIGNVAVVFFLSGIGALVLAIGVVVKTYLVWWYSVLLVCRLLEMGLAEYVSRIFRTVLAAIFSAFAVWIFCRIFQLQGGKNLLLSAPMYVAIYAAGSFLLNRVNVRHALLTLRGRLN